MERWLRVMLVPLAAQKATGLAQSRCPAGSIGVSPASHRFTLSLFWKRSAFLAACLDGWRVIFFCGRASWRVTRGTGRPTARSKGDPHRAGD